MNRWVEETFHPHWRVRLEADEILHEVKTEHQHLVIFKNATWGTVLMLDGVCQLTTKDEFIYHEMMAHVPLMVLDKPKRVLVIGGGDGGILREVLKYRSLKSVMFAELDEDVVSRREAEGGWLDAELRDSFPASDPLPHWPGPPRPLDDADRARRQPPRRR